MILDPAFYSSWFWGVDRRGSDVSSERRRKVEGRVNNDVEFRFPEVWVGPRDELPVCAR